MNVARKSTTKLPHNWSHIQAKEDETDSGIASTDSTDYHDSTSDNFQEVLFNLKALNGGPDVLETDRLELKESNTVSITSVKKENGNISVGVPATREKGKDKDEDQDLLDQINDIVNEGKSCTSQSGRVAGSGHGAGQNNKVTIGSTSSPNTDEDEDMVMIIGEDNKGEKSKELTPKDRNGTGTPRKHPLRIGDKVRSTVHSIMSKLVQSGNPEVSSLLNKVKSDECVETASSADVPSIALARHDKGNLFDNLDFDICNKESKLSKADSSSGHQKPVLGGKDCKQLPASPKAQEKARNSAGKRKNDIAEPFDNSLPKSKAADVLDSNGPSAHPEVDSHSLDNCDDQDRLTELKSGVIETNQTHSVTDEKNDVTKISRNDDLDGPEPDQNKPSDSPQEKKNACDATGLASLCADGGKENMLPKNECKSSVCEKDDVSEKDKEVEPSMDTSLKSHDDGEKDCERKRQNESQESESDGSQPAKRSRLDWMIGKLGERISIPPESVETESLDCEDSNMEDSESAEKHSEGVSVSASEDEDERTSVSSPKTLRLTSKELDSVICSKVKAYLARQQATELKLLNARVQELLKSEEEWRNKAKDLERKLTELSLKQHKLEKRKAHTAALRSITTRNIGVQVNEEKLKSSTPQKVPKLGHSGGGTALASPSSPTSSAPSLVISSLPGQTRMLTPVSSSSPTKVTAITVGQSLGSRNTSVAQLLSQTAHMPTAATSVSSSSKPPSVTSSNGPVPSSAVVPVSNASVRSLLDQVQVVTSPGQVHNLVPQQVVRQITPISQGIQGSTSAILLSSSAGTQIVTTPNMPRPPGMYQVVTIANAPPLRPGSLLTVVSGQPALMRQPGPASTNISRAQTPQILAPPPPTMTIMRPAQVLGLSTTVRPSLATSTTSTTARMPVVATSVLPSSSAPLAMPDSNPSNKTKIRIGHPAPLPAAVYRNVLNETKPPPPQPGLKISRVKQGIVLSWNMVIPKDCVEIAAYQLFAYQETSSPPSTSLWKKVGDVKALPLPMACTLTQFQDGNKYHFAVRAVDIHGRTSNFSEPAFIFLSKTS